MPVRIRPTDLTNQRVKSILIYGAVRTLLVAILIVACWPVGLSAQTSGPLRIYVLRSGDEGSDQAVLQALTERGHKVSLGVRVSQLDVAPVQLSDFHAVVALGAAEDVSNAIINMLSGYLRNSGGLVVDGPLMYRLRYGPDTTLRLPATWCNYFYHSGGRTNYSRTESADPVIHNGTAPSFDVKVSTVSGMSEQCLAAAGGARVLFTSKTTDERTARPAVLTSEPGPKSRAVAFSVALRMLELDSLDFRRTFVNSVEWAAALSTPTTPPDEARKPQPRRIYILRTGDDASDQAMVRALTERGHQVSLGVRASQLDSAAVRLSDYHAVVATGASADLPSSVIKTLATYVDTSGGLLTDGPLMYRLRYGPEETLRLPAKWCNYYFHRSGATTLERIDPPDPVVLDGIPPSFNFGLSTVAGMNEQCLSTAADGKLLLYSRTAGEDVPRPGVLSRDVGPRSRTMSFSTAIRARELRDASFRRLFANAVDWVAAKSEPTDPPLSSSTSDKLRVYVLRSGDAPSDTAVSDALRERGHDVSLGVQANELTAVQPLSDFDAVVALGSQNVNSGVVSALRRYIGGGGRLVVDGVMLYHLRYDPATDLQLAANWCNYYFHRSGTTTYDRIDPSHPVLHNGVAPGFELALSTVSGMHEQCLTPLPGGKVIFYSRTADEDTARPGVMVNDIAPNSRTVVFSAAIRQRELRSPDFRRLFVNAVEWAAGKIQPPPALRPSPEQLRFVFSSSAVAPRTQNLQITPTTLTPATFAVTTATASGGDWLSAVPAAATTPANITVRVSPTFLGPGTYSGEVVLTSGSAVVRVPVTTTVDGTAPCVYSISPGTASFGSAGGAGRIGIAAPPGCAWSVTSAVPWISITSPVSGAGPGTASFTATANPGVDARSSSFTVAGQMFTVFQAGTSLSFGLDADSLQLTLREGASAETRIVSILSTASAPFTATASGGAWLSVTPASGTAPGSVAISVNPAEIPAGTYRGSVSVRIPTATPSERSVPVVLTVAPAGDSRLTLETTSLTISSVEGGIPQTVNVKVSNSGRSPVPFTVATHAPWLTVTPVNGSVSGATTASLTITADPRGLKAGSYTDHVAIASAGGDRTALDVLLTVSATRNSILLSQSGLTYTAVAQGGRVPPQAFGVLNIGEGVMDWTAEASTLSGGSWLSLSTGRGSSSADLLNVSMVEAGINAANLRPGEYHGRITITSPTAGNSPQIVSVILQVLPPGSDPGPIVRPTGLIFITPAGSGSGPASQEVTVSNLTSDTRNFNSSRLTTDNASWFTHTPVQAAVSPTQPTRIAVQPATTGLSAGVRRGVLTLLFSDGAVQNVNILSIVAPQASAAAKDSRQAASCPSPRLVLTHTALRQAFVVTAGQGVPIEVKVADTCGNLLTPRSGASASVSANFSNGDARLPLVHTGGGLWSGTWRPVRASDRVVLTVTAFNVEGTSVQAEQIDISGAVRDTSRTPIVTAGGLMHGASFVTGVPLAPGTLITIRGTNLADSNASSDQLPLPRELNGVEVLLGNRSLPLLFVSKDQANVQVPYDVPANTRHQISVRRGEDLSVPESIAVTEAMPGIFTKNQSGTGQGVIARKDAGYVLAEPGTPAAVGETVVLYCTGMGAVLPSVEAGSAASAEPPARVPAAVDVSIGGRSAEILFAGLTAGRVGVYEIHAKVPEGIEASDTVNVTITVAGQTSPSVTMAVK